MREDAAALRFPQAVGAIVMWRGTGARAGQRILLVSYHFPPDQTIGARRWEQFAPYFTERGWGLDVVTCASSGESDSGCFGSLPEGVRVFGVPKVARRLERLEFMAWRTYRGLCNCVRRPGDAALTPALRDKSERKSNRSEFIDRSEVRWRLYSMRGLLRAYWTWLQSEGYRAWARRAAGLAQTIIEPGKHFAVITSGPPHLTHEAGREISQRTGLPFVMDMRDPWSLGERVHESVASPLWFRLARRYERAAVAKASLIVANTEAAREALAGAYPETRQRLITVMNGSDEYPLPRSGFNHRFTIAYAGTIYRESHPRSLFRGAARVIRDLGLTPAEFGIEFMGNDAPGSHSLVEMAREEGIADFLSTTTVRPHDEALQFMSRATMLVSFPGWDTSTVPAKIFEYVRFDAWLMALVDPGSAAERLLRGSAADVLVPDNTAAVAAAIQRHFLEYRSGIQPTRTASDDRFSRRRQAEILLAAISRLGPRHENGNELHERTVGTWSR